MWEGLAHKHKARQAVAGMDSAQNQETGLRVNPDIIQCVALGNHLALALPFHL